MTQTRISAAALTEVERALHDYIQLVLEANMSAWAESDYIDRADQFVRWLKGEFQPGARTKRLPKKASSSETPRLRP